jgi:hypothetical protein
MGMQAFSRWLGRNNDHWCQKQCTRQRSVDGRRCSCRPLAYWSDAGPRALYWVLFLVYVEPWTTHFIYWVLLLVYVRFRTAHFNPDGHHWSEVGTFFQYGGYVFWCHDDDWMSAGGRYASFPLFPYILWFQVNRPI